MKVLLLDAYNLLFRSFVTIPASVTDARGAPINAPYGLLASILRMMREHGPTHIMAAFDVPETPTFRSQLFPAYQAQRGPMGGERAEEFTRQVGVASGLFPHLGIPCFHFPGYEADDIMGSLAHRILAENGSSIIVSTDRDLLQLVRPGISVVQPGKVPLHIQDDHGVRERMGTGPDRIVMLKALAGDPSDNIPGVAGIGEKTARQLVNQYGNVEALYSRLTELPARVSAALARGREEVVLFQRIVTIVTDLPISIADVPKPRFGPDTRVRDLLQSADAEMQSTGTPGGIRTPDL